MWICFACCSVLDAVRTNSPRLLRILLLLRAGLGTQDMNMALLHAVRSNYDKVREIIILIHNIINHYQRRLDIPEILDHFSYCTWFQ